MLSWLSGLYSYLFPSKKKKTTDSKELLCHEPNPFDPQAPIYARVRSVQELNSVIHYADHMPSYVN